MASTRRLSSSTLQIPGGDGKLPGKEACQHFATQRLRFGSVQLAPPPLGLPSLLARARTLHANPVEFARNLPGY